MAQQKTIDLSAGSPDNEKGSKAYELTKLKHVSIERSGLQSPVEGQDHDIENVIHAREPPLLGRSTEAPNIILEPYSTRLWADDSELVLLRRVLDTQNRKQFDNVSFNSSTTQVY